MTGHPECTLRGRSPLDDPQLAAAGDRAAFARLYHQHAARVHTLARRLLSKEDADDATQEVFIRLWDKLPLYKADAPFGAWLHRLALNVILRRREVERKPIRAGSDVNVDTLAARPVTLDAAIDVGTALARLDPGMRDVVVLHDMEGYRHEEIAQQLNITVASSKMRLHRARHALRTLMNR